MARSLIEQRGSVLVFRCACGFVESEPASCCRKCGTKDEPTPMVATLALPEPSKWGVRHGDDGSECMEPMWCSRAHYKTPEVDRAA